MLNPLKNRCQTLLTYSVLSAIPIVTLFPLLMAQQYSLKIICRKYWTNITTINTQPSHLREFRPSLAIAPFCPVLL